MTQRATTDGAARITGTRAALAWVLAAAGWACAAQAAQPADSGMIVIPGRGESAETALANATASTRAAEAADAVHSGEASGDAAKARAADGAALGAGPSAATGGTSLGLAARDLPAGRAVAARADREDAWQVAPVAAQDAGAAAVTATAGARTAAAPPRLPRQPRHIEPAPANPSAPRIDDALASSAPRALAARGAPAAPRTIPARPPLPACADTPGSSAAVAQTSAARTLAAPANASQAACAAARPSPAAPTAAGQDSEAIRSAALAFLRQQAAGLPGKVTITVAPALPRGLAACTTLEPFLPTGARLWGRTTVGVRCAGERPWTLYLQAKLTVQATYYVAARALAPGDTLTAADLVARDGDLTLLPLAVITEPAQAVGASALTRVAAGLPLRRDLLKSAASVSIGQTVRVIASGPGFTISAEGSALGNAAPGQPVRVRMAAGQIVTAVVKDAATVEISL
ncbi:flagellar basal body P-ring formation chaperone FlgA [Burkholderia sp. TSV86]|uniref:flagellar basal body P-ring formation chaperone FlgA n=1 Tax=Burkholderia sp. TSV86 TaxID=1385594 RepID=UPI000757EAF7|nr:flagellar basal body P-ring formation chaperone FlgA [Burkholderia sp. TSV86]KVE33301.1 flagellar biosynthesis protein FlgA [Burkholderia sp. TSV86]